MFIKSTDPSVLFSRIDGRLICVTVEAIALALGCPSTPPSPSYPLPPRQFPPVEIIEHMCGGQFATTRRTATRRAYLPQHLLLIDSVFKHNVCLRGQKDERDESFLSALYGFYMGHWVNVPALIWEGMSICFQKLVKKPTPRRQSWALPYPELITLLLGRELRFVIASDEEVDSTAFPTYGPFNWKMSQVCLPPVVDVPSTPPSPLPLPPGPDPLLSLPAPPPAPSAEPVGFDRLITRVDGLRVDLAILRQDLTTFSGQHAQDMVTLQHTLQRLLARPPSPPVQ